MSNVIEVFRRCYTVDLEEGSSRLAVGVFSPSNLTYVAHVDPAKILAGSKHIPGVKKAPIGEELRSYRFEKQLANSANYPMEVPAAGYAFKNAEKQPDLYDAEFVKFLLSRGASSIPIIVTTSQIDDLADTLKSMGHEGELKTLDELNRDLIEGAPTSIDEGDPDYSQFVTLDELEQSVNAHTLQLDYKMSDDREDGVDDLYKIFSSNPALIDALIMMGAHGAFVKKGWDGLSVYEGMKAEVKSRDSILENDLPAMELVDRFARLYERHAFYAKAHEFNKVVDTSSEDRIGNLCGILAAKFDENPEAMALAKTELCFEAQCLLSSSMHGGSHFRPSADTAPEPTLT